MRFPSKVTPYKESIMAKFPVVLALLEQEDLTPSELYKKTKSKVNGVSELVEILECLFVLGRVELLDDEEVLHYVEAN
jgi:hypothetical protein